MLFHPEIRMPQASSGIFAIEGEAQICKQKKAA